MKSINKQKFYDEVYTNNSNFIFSNYIKTLILTKARMEQSFLNYVT